MNQNLHYNDIIPPITKPRVYKKKIELHETSKLAVLTNNYFGVAILL